MLIGTWCTFYDCNSLTFIFVRALKCGFSFLNEPLQNRVWYAMKKLRTSLKLTIFVN